MRPFRFGVNLTGLDSRDGWLDKSRMVEELGYDVLAFSDHIGGQAPFAGLAAAAAVTHRVKLAAAVLNSALWNPVLLTREVMTAGRLTGGRFELGLGAGYVRAEFESAGTPWGTPGSRVRRLEETVAEVSRLLDHPREMGDPSPPPRPPLMIGANGDRALRLAARQADIVSFAAARLKPGATHGTLQLLDADEVTERVAFFEKAAERGAAVERHILAQTVQVTDDRAGAIAALRRRMPHLSAEQVAAIPTVLIGTPRQIADQLRQRRETFGISYVCVQEHAARDFASVVNLLSGT